MAYAPTRRSFALAGLASALAMSARAEAGRRLAGLEAALADIFAGGGRLGVAVLDPVSGEMAGLRPQERFALCSTSKVLIAAAALARADSGALRLDDRIAISQADILAYAPFAKTRVGGEATLAELCGAAIAISDNTAANLLSARLGGPAAVTAYVRTLGDATTRLDRTEPDLNQAEPGDPRDTTTPAAMARTLARLTTGDALSAESRARLVAWLLDCRTGLAKLRAGLPSDWRVGDKTGAGGHGASNDVAVAWPPGRPPLVVAAYLAETGASDAAKNAIHAAIGRAIAAACAD